MIHSEHPGTTWRHYLTIISNILGRKYKKNNKCQFLPNYKSCREILEIIFYVISPYPHQRKVGNITTKPLREGDSTKVEPNDC